MGMHGAAMLLLPGSFDAEMCAESTWFMLMMSVCERERMRRCCERAVMYVGQPAMQ